MKKATVIKAGIAAAAVAGLGLTVSPVIQQTVPGMIEEQINMKINGTAVFSSIQIGWNGDIWLENPLIRDMAGKTVVEGKAVRVSIGALDSMEALLTGSPLKAIQKITVQEPVVYVKERANGSWDIADLIKKNETDTSMDLRGRILIEDGRALLALREGRTADVREINGAVDLYQYPDIHADIKAQLDGHALAVSGDYQSAENYSASIQADWIDLTYAKRFIDTSSLALEAGHGEDIRMHIRQKDGVFAFSGKGKAAGVSGQYETYRMEQGEAAITWDEQGAAVSGGKMQINGQTILVNGTVSFADDPELQFIAEAPALQIEAVLPEQEAKGAAAVSLSVEGTLNHPKLFGRAEAKKLQYAGYEAEDLEADVFFENEMVQITAAQAKIGGGSIAGNGSYDMGTGKWQAHVLAEQIDISQLPAAYTAGMQGILSGSASAAGTADTIEQARAFLGGTQLMYNGIQADEGELQAEWNQGEIEIPWLRLVIGNGGISGYGKIGSEGTSLRLAGSHIPLAAFSSAAQTEMSGDLAFTAQVHGADSYTGDIRISAADGKIKDIPFDEIYGGIRWEAGTLYAEDLCWKFRDEQHTIQGSVQLGGERNLDLTVDSQKGRIEKFIAAAGYGDIPFTGWFNNHVHIGGTISRPAVTGRAGLWEGSAGSYLYDNIFIRYEYTDNVLTIEDLRAHAMDSTILASGTAGDHLNISVTSPDLDLKRLSRSLPVNGNGKIQLSGTITGTPDAPRFEGNLHGEMLNINGSTISDVSGEVHFIDNILNFTNVNFLQGGGTYFFHGGLNMNTNQLFGNGKITNGDLRQLLLLAIPDLQALQGKIEGTLDIGGTLENPAFYVHGDITDGILGSVPIRPSVIDMGMENHKFTIKDLNLNLGEGYLRVQGMLDLYGEMDIHAQAKNLDTNVLNALAGTNENITGAIDFDVTAKGPSNNPNVVWNANVENASYNGVHFDQLKADGTMENRTIQLKEFVIAKEPYQLTAYGKIPLAVFWNREKNYRNETMDLRLNFDKANLEALPMLTSWVTSASGPMKGELALSGTFNDPVIQGKVSVENGRIWIADTEIPIDLQGEIEGKGKEFTFLTDGNIGKGSFHGDGTVAWNGLDVTSYSGSVRFNDLELTHPYYHGSMTGEFTIEPGRRNPRLTGTLDLQDAMISIPASFEMGESDSQLGLDVTVRANKNVRLYNPLLYDVTIGGAAQFRGTSSYPVPSGKFTVQKGSLRYLNTKFQITSGDANFNQIGSFLPSLDVAAEARKNPYKIQMTVKGPVDHMDLKLVSTPPLSEQQIVSLLTLQTTGKQDSSVDSEDVAGLISAGLEMTFAGGIEALAGKYLGLDYLNVSTGSLDPYEKTTVANENYYNIEMGKYIFPDLLIAAGFGVNNDQNSYGFRYNLNNSSVINAWKNSEGNYYIGAEYTYTFW